VFVAGFIVLGCKKLRIGPILLLAIGAAAGIVAKAVGL